MFTVLIGFGVHVGAFCGLGGCGMVLLLGWLFVMFLLCFCLGFNGGILFL